MKARGDKKIKQKDKKEDKKESGNKVPEKDAGGPANKANLELHEDPFRIEPLLGYFSKDDP